LRTAVGTLLRQAVRETNEPLNILTCPTHERCESALALTGHAFWALTGPGIKTWNDRFSPLPHNYHVLKGMELPAGIDFDVVLSQSRFAHYPLLSRLANDFHVPLVTYEHTMVYPDWTPEMRVGLRKMSGHADVFISETSKWAWGFGAKGVTVEHGIDSDLFSPAPWESRQTVALSIVNDWINRDAPCGYQYWREATKGMPVKVVGDTPGLSEAAATVGELADHYRSCRVFVNTSLVSPLPMALLEAMASGCVCISTNTCEIPNVLKDMHNGILCESPREMRAVLADVLSDPDAYRELGLQARETVRTRFGLDRFVRQWDEVLRKAADTPFTTPLHTP
jgi:hypothetical protein